ncbi:MAG: hypothetical protein R8G66_35035 [Cytophagales bacterium]|nr:hypothetical protein [Cytophagales bacterium]
MLADGVKNIGNGEISKGLEVDASIHAVVHFIDQYFPRFAEKVRGEITTSESSLTDKLCTYFNRQASEYPFFFQPEKLQDHTTGQSARADLGTMSQNENMGVGDYSYQEWESFFAIEAKRLPTPGHNRQREYVIGQEKENGGIERFKKRIHGSDLEYSAIIAYVQKEDFEYWYIKINDWIGELIANTSGEWKEEDKLIKTPSYSGPLARFQSDHQKNTEEPPDKIRLFHFWIALAEEE